MSYNDMGFSMNMTGATIMLLAQNQIQEAISGQFRDGQPFTRKLSGKKTGNLSFSSSLKPA
jgi:hypothetical protein